MCDRRGGVRCRPVGGACEFLGRPPPCRPRLHFFDPIARELREAQHAIKAQIARDQTSEGAYNVRLPRGASGGSLSTGISSEVSAWATKRLICN